MLICCEIIVRSSRDVGRLWGAVEEVEEEAAEVVAEEAAEEVAAGMRRMLVSEGDEMTIHSEKEAGGRNSCKINRE